MPRPKVYKNERIQIQIRLTTATRRRLEKQAAKRLVSKNLLAERAIEEALDRWEAEKESTLVTSA
jgi:predicted transcriptional regulator